eukprot:gene3604-4128_t
MGGKLSKEDILKITTETHLNKTDIKKLVEEYKIADRDENGTLDKFEFAALIKTRLPSYPPADLEILFNAFDKDQSGTIDFAELTVAMSILCKGTAEEKLGFLFDLYDMNKDEVLDKKEAWIVVEKMVEIGFRCGVSKSVPQIGEMALDYIEKMDPENTNIIKKETWIKQGCNSPQMIGLLGLNVENIDI